MVRDGLALNANTYWCYPLVYFWYPIHLRIGININVNLYVASGFTKMGIAELTVAVWPWLLTMLGMLS